ncbi:MAG: ABC transporter substrate-binding protein [Planctomycetota bacterium]
MPSLTLELAERIGPAAPEGVVGAVAWCWKVPRGCGSARGQEFVAAFAARHRRYPDAAGAAAYSVLHAWKAAAERAGTLEGAAVVRALEGHTQTLLKDEETWRD